MQHKSRTVDTYIAEQFTYMKKRYIPGNIPDRRFPTKINMKITFLIIINSNKNLKGIVKVTLTCMFKMS